MVMTSQMIESKYIKKEDCTPPLVLTIKNCSLEDLGQGDMRWVLRFSNHPKPVVLNVTKIRQLEASYGQDTDYWLGKKVKLSHDPTVMYAGKIVGGIKLVTSNAPAAPTPPPPAAEHEFDDEIPF